MLLLITVCIMATQAHITLIGVLIVHKIRK